ncbi:transglutaminase-like domain-containing protein [Demequina salsinemoris]|uniref:transglutaminase-like domain-containing protein n=1 Tax=Demequina salsinemoris TaxID=577470 RepID=UPI000782B12D|nr:transglutaminase-like domain-containing protein [Demequina salsinemoris]
MPLPSPRSLALTLAAVAASVALAVWSAWPVYETPRLVIVAGVGAVIGVGPALLTRARSWSTWAGSGLVVAAFAVAVVPTTMPGSLSDPGGLADALVAALASVVTGWKHLLTITIPVGDYQALLVPFLALVAACTWGATVLATGRGRTASLAVLPLLAMPAFGMAFGSSTPEASAQWGPFTVPEPTRATIVAAAVAVCAAWLLGRARLDRSDALRIARSQAATVRRRGGSMSLAARRRLVSTALIAAAVYVGLGIAPATVASEDRTALRDEVVPASVIAAQPSPLSAYRSWFTDASYDAVLLTVSGALDGQRLRIATLDSYEGQSFTVDADAASFARRPTVQSADLTVTIGPAYTGVWVPVATASGGAPRFLGARASELADAYYADEDLDTAMLALDTVDAGLGLVAGDSYTIAATEDDGTATLATATGGDATVSEDDYPALAAWVDQQSVGRTGADLIELVSRLRERGYLSHAAREAGAESWIADLSSRGPYVFEPVRAGHTSAHVEALFQSLLDQELRAGDDPSDELLVAAVGDDEKFAASAAVLARYLGFESRVVVGIRLGQADASDGVPACDGTCTGANVTAWVEVRADSTDAWTVLDATPQFESTPTRIRQGESLPQNATDADMPASEVIEPPSVQGDETADAATDDEAAQEDEPVALRIALAGLALSLTLALLAAPLLVLPVAKVIRRSRRRRAKVPEVAVVGAWEEMVDAYVDAGLDVPERLTRGELADLLERDRALVLAAMADRAVFDLHAPTSEAARESWRLVDAERQDLARRGSRWRRLRATLSLRSVLRRARPAPQPVPALVNTGRRTHAQH